MQHFTWIFRLALGGGLGLWSKRACAWLGAVLALGLSLGLSPGAWAADFLPPDQAFQVSVSPSPQGGVRAHFTLAPGVYLYREQFKARLQANVGPEITASWQLPGGDMKHDPTFDKDVEVYHHDIDAQISWTGLSAEQAELTVVYQGCADAGLCYPPQKQRFALAMDAQGKVTAVTPVNASGHWWTVVPVFFLAG
ncbi:MAG: hypothetical protein RI920_938, partial [Pseudomonadota bacterium]